MRAEVFDLRRPLGALLPRATVTDQSTVAAATGAANARYISSMGAAASLDGLDGFGDGGMGGKKQLNAFEVAAAAGDVQGGCAVVI